MKYFLWRLKLRNVADLFENSDRNLKNTENHDVKVQKREPTLNIFW